MKTSYVVFILFLVSYLCEHKPLYAQTVIPVKDSVGFKAYIMRRGETATLLYDTAYILNKKIFRLYKETYLKAKKGDLAWQRLSDVYADLVQRQDSLIETKELYYNLLKQNMDSLTNKTGRFLDAESAGLNEIRTNVTNANKDLDSIKTSLNTALDKMKTQKKQKLQLAIGGFAIGVLVTSLIFVVAK